LRPTFVPQVPLSTDGGRLSWPDNTVSQIAQGCLQIAIVANLGARPTRGTMDRQIKIRINFNDKMATVIKREVSGKP